MTDIVQILREMQQEEDCPMLVHWRFLRLSERSPGFALNWQPPASTRHAEGKTRRMFRLSQ